MDLSKEEEEALNLARGLVNEAKDKLAMAEYILVGCGWKLTAEHVGRCRADIRKFVGELLEHATLSIK